MLKRFIKKLIIKYREWLYRKQASIGHGIQFATSSVCQNTGTQKDVCIGNHGCIFCTIQTYCGGKIKIGNNVYIGPNTVIQAKEQIDIADHVIISNNVLIADNNSHPVSPVMRRKMTECDDYLTDELWTWKYAKSEPIIIEENVWIGKEAIILKGVKIGQGSIVAMRAVVTHDVPPYTVVAGNPARVVKKITQEEV